MISNNGNRGSSAHVLLNLLNKAKKREIIPFCKFNNNTEAQMLDFIYHMTLKLLKNCIFGVASFTHR